MSHQKPKKKFNEMYLILFAVVFILIASFFIRSPSADGAEKITEMIIGNNEISFASNGVIDNEKLEKIKNMDYLEIKKTLGANSDFCLYIEDELGNIILSKGSDKLEKDEISCR